MKEIKITLPYGEKSVTIGIGKGEVLGTIEINQYTGLRPQNRQEELGEIRRALRQPLAGLPLADLVRNTGKIVAMVSDETRPAPTVELIRAIVEEMAKGGKSPEELSVVVARGAHPTPSLPDNGKYLPKELVDRVPLTFSGAQGYIHCGTTSQGTPVEIDRTVAGAGFLIATGNIELHRMAGFSGGAKALLPGVASRISIEGNHRLITQFKADPGEFTDNIMRADLEEAAKMVGLKYILNVVLDQHKKVVRAFAGDVIYAHRTGARLAKKLFSVEVTGPADVVVASAGGSPKDGSLYQVIKALLNALQVVRQGGEVILVAQCPEGVGDSYFKKLIRQAESLPKVKNELGKEFVLGNHKAEGLVTALEKAKVYVVCDTDMKIPLLQTYPIKRVQELVNSLLLEPGPTGGEKTLWIMPYAAYTFPKVCRHTC